MADLMVDSLLRGSRDLHPGVEDLRDGPDLQGWADGEQPHEALRWHPHPADVDALQPLALVHQRHQPGLRHMAAAPQDDALKICAAICNCTQRFVCDKCPTNIQVLQRISP
uniref:Uncharacterized protein n=1 Tax=Arundo donax TaxID=35708 RepID=A0A0A9GMX8_ARUDO